MTFVTVNVWKRRIKYTNIQCGANTTVCEYYLNKVYVSNTIGCATFHFQSSNKVNLDSFRVSEPSWDRHYIGEFAELRQAIRFKSLIR